MLRVRALGRAHHAVGEGVVSCAGPLLPAPPGRARRPLRASQKLGVPPLHILVSQSEALERPPQLLARRHRPVALRERCGELLLKAGGLRLKRRLAGRRPPVACRGWGSVTPLRFAVRSGAGRVSAGGGRKEARPRRPGVLCLSAAWGLDRGERAKSAPCRLRPLLCQWRPADWRKPEQVRRIRTQPSCASAEAVKQHRADSPRCSFELHRTRNCQVRRESHPHVKVG